jgi:hypothetical protein
VSYDFLIFIFSDNEMITSFSNPNYHMNDDELNSNITPLTTPITPTTHQYYQDQIYADPDILTSRNPTSKRRKNYAQLDLTSMGIDLNSEQQQQLRNNDTQNICSPDSLCSVDSHKSEDFVDCDNEPRPNDENSEESDDQEEEVSTPYAEKSSFLGYYASLEKSAKLQQRQQQKGEQQKAEEVKSTETQKEKSLSDRQKDADSKRESQSPEG